MIYLDLDGVLVDLVPELCKALGFDIKNWSAGEYNVSKVFHMEHQFIWNYTNEAFWAELPWTADGKQILEACWRAVDHRNVCIATTSAEYAFFGKQQWIERELPWFWAHRQFVFTESKKLLAHDGAVLIDDCDDNVNMFRKAGGKAILVPRWWNSAWGQADGALEIVVQEMAGE